MAQLLSTSLALRRYSEETMSAAVQRQEVPYLKKTVVSPQRRMVFVAGLEGSGHHLWSRRDDAVWKIAARRLPTSKDMIIDAARFSTLDPRLASVETIRGNPVCSTGSCLELEGLVFASKFCDA